MRNQQVVFANVKKWTANGTEKIRLFTGATCGPLAEKFDFVSCLRGVQLGYYSDAWNKVNARRARD